MIATTMHYLCIIYAAITLVGGYDTSCALLECRDIFSVDDAPAYLISLFNTYLVLFIYLGMYHTWIVRCGAKGNVDGIGKGVFRMIWNYYVVAREECYTQKSPDNP